MLRIETEPPGPARRGLLSLRLSSRMSSHYCCDTLRFVIGDEFLDGRYELRYCRFFDLQPVANVLLRHSQLELVCDDDIPVRIGDLRALGHRDSDWIGRGLAVW